MLDPNRYSLDAATVGFRKRMGQSVDWGSFNEALQTQTESVKVRRELQETPITEIHVMGGQGFGVAGNQKTNEMERQARQMNGYVLRSFYATGGAVVLPTKHNEGLMATPQNLGLPQYAQYNGVVGNYVSSFTEPLNAPMDSGVMALAKAGIQARSEASTNPFKYLQFQLNMHSSLAEIQALEEKHKQLRAYNQEGNIQQAYEADQKARRTGNRSGRAARRHNLMTTPSTVRNVLHGHGTATPNAGLAQAVRESLSDNVITPTPQRERGAEDRTGRLSELDMILGDISPISGMEEDEIARTERRIYDLYAGTENDLTMENPFNRMVSSRTEEMPDLDGAEDENPTIRVSRSASRPPDSRRRQYEESQDDSVLIDNLQEQFNGVSREEAKKAYFESDTYYYAKLKLAAIQQGDMTSVAEKQNLALSTNAVTTEEGLQLSDVNMSYGNTIDPAFERKVAREALVLSQVNPYNTSSNLTSYVSPPTARIDYERSPAMMIASPSGVATFRPSDDASTLGIQSQRMEKGAVFTPSTRKRQSKRKEKDL